MSFYQDNRFGSSKPATLAHWKSAGLLSGQGIGLTHDETKRHEARSPNDGGTAMFAGAGTGKSSSRYIPAILGNQFGNGVIFCPRGEVSETTMLACSLDGYECYYMNPAGMLDLPNHTTNIFDNQTVDNPAIIANSQKRSADLCPIPPGGGKANWPAEDAQDWLTQMQLLDASINGVVSPKGVNDIFCSIQGNLDEWEMYLRRGLDCPYPSVRRWGPQMMQLQEEGREGFTAPMGTLHTKLKFMQDERALNSISGNDFSLSWLFDPARKVRLFVVTPIEYMDVWGPMVRNIFGRVIQEKLQNPSHQQVHILIDECGQLGNFPSVVELYTFGRGAGLIPYCSWQEVAQIYAAFGVELAQAIIGSARYRLFSGIATLQTAELVSQMGGDMTLDYDDTLQQSGAKRQRQELMLSAMKGNIGMMEAAAGMRHLKVAETHQTKQPRRAITPDEVMNLPPGAAITFATGMLPGYSLGYWLKYFERPEFAGRYLPNSYHDPNNVLIPRRFGGPKRVPMVTERVPASLAHLPQYADGYWKYIQGYRPNVGS